MSWESETQEFMESVASNNKVFIETINNIVTATKSINKRLEKQEKLILRLLLILSLNETLSINDRKELKELLIND